jgi:hypothetical protein
METSAAVLRRASCSSSSEGSSSRRWSPVGVADEAFAMRVAELERGLGISRCGTARERELDERGGD